MAEKKVSVRLVAEGGRRVRAELEGVGEAGARGFGRLSREMELANTRLAAFARRAGLALGNAGFLCDSFLDLVVFAAENVRKDLLAVLCVRLLKESGNVARIVRGMVADRLGQRSLAGFCSCIVLHTLQQHRDCGGQNAFDLALACAAGLSEFAQGIRADNLRQQLCRIAHIPNSSLNNKMICIQYIIIRV